MSERQWLTGDAMLVALQLRELQPGDELIAKREATHTPWRGYTSGQQALVEKRQVWEVEKRYPRYDGQMWWICRPKGESPGPGLFVIPEVIEAWRPKP